MHALAGIAALGCLSTVVAHGFVRSLEIDGKTYYSANAGLDEKYAVKSIQYTAGPPRKPFVTDATSRGIACNDNPKAPALVAPIRAGASITFQWSPWFISHLGPIMSYLAPYSGDIAAVDVNQLQFFKTSEEGLLPDAKTWAVDVLMQNGNTSSTVIPWDIKPGNYVLRHELISLHYSTEDSLYHKKPDKLLGPQHYISCFALNITGSGSATPEGVPFPGAYKAFKQEPGLYFDIWRNVSPYPIPGPRPYVPSSPAPPLPPAVKSTQSPTGSAEKDAEYLAAVRATFKRSDDFAADVNSKHLGYGGNPEMTGPPPGSVPPGAVVKGAKWRPTEGGLGGVPA